MGREGKSGVLVPPGVDLLPPGVVVLGKLPPGPGRGTGPPGGIGREGKSGVLVPPGVDLLPPGVVTPASRGLGASTFADGWGATLDCDFEGGGGLIEGGTAVPG